MKHISSLAFTISLLLIMPILRISAYESDSNSTYRVSVPLDRVTISSSTPIFHAPSTPIPLQCEYETINNTVYVTFSNSIGSVFVCVENPNTGSLTYHTIPSNAGVQTIPITDYGNLLRIYFQLSSGVTYMGEFYS